MKVFGFVGAVLDDEVRFERVREMVGSMAEQEDDNKLDGLFFSGGGGGGGGEGHHVTDLCKDWNGVVKDKQWLFLQNCKQPLSRFWQLGLLLKKHKGKLHDDPRKVWFLCSDDDALWHPQRVSAYRKAIERFADEDVTCVAFASVTEVLGRGGREITCAAHVDLALSERQIEIKPWIYRTDTTEVEKERSVQFYDLCVRADVVLQFFKETPEHMLRNMYCDVAFCDFVTSYRGTRSIFLQNNQWNYFWRHPDPRYDMRYATALQFASAQHRVKDIYALCGNYIQRLAEMSALPCLEATAQSNFDSVANTLEMGERAMLLYEYQQAQKKYASAGGAGAGNNIK